MAVDIVFLRFHNSLPPHSGEPEAMLESRSYCAQSECTGCCIGCDEPIVRRVFYRFKCDSCECPSCTFDLRHVADQVVTTYLKCELCKCEKCKDKCNKCGFPRATDEQQREMFLRAEQIGKKAAVGGTAKGNGRVGCRRGTIQRADFKHTATVSGSPADWRKTGADWLREERRNWRFCWCSVIERLEARWSKNFLKVCAALLVTYPDAITVGGKKGPSWRRVHDLARLVRNNAVPTSGSFVRPARKRALSRRNSKLLSAFKTGEYQIRVPRSDDSGKELGHLAPPVRDVEEMSVDKILYGKMPGAKMCLSEMLDVLSTENSGWWRRIYDPHLFFYGMGSLKNVVYRWMFPGELVSFSFPRRINVVLDGGYGGVLEGVIEDEWNNASENGPE
jgi:hypothetical protein